MGSTGGKARWVPDCQRPQGGWVRRTQLDSRGRTAKAAPGRGRGEPPPTQSTPSDLITQGMREPSAPDTPHITAGREQVPGRGRKPLAGRATTVRRVGPQATAQQGAARTAMAPLRCRLVGRGDARPRTRGSGRCGCLTYWRAACAGERGYRAGCRRRLLACGVVGVGGDVSRRICGSIYHVGLAADARARGSSRGTHMLVTAPGSPSPPRLACPLVRQRQPRSRPTSAYDDVRGRCRLASSRFPRPAGPA